MDFFFFVIKNKGCTKSEGNEIGRGEKGLYFVT